MVSIWLGFGLGLGLILGSVRRQPISYIDIHLMGLQTENSEDVTICYFPSTGTENSIRLHLFLVRKDGK